MRVFAITDIHGNNDLFRKSLKKIRLKKSDKLFILGDTIDRGKDAKGVLDTILLLLEHGFDIECILGNHEKMLLDSLHNQNEFNRWMLNGGDKTLLSFLTNSTSKIPKMYIDFLKSFKTHLIYKNYILVHASLNMKIDNPYADLDTLLWERNPKLYYDKNWLGNRKVIHGHTPNSIFDIRDAISKNKDMINIDNGNYLKKDGFGSLCILELNSLELNFVK